MKLIDLKCDNCGADLQVNMDNKQAFCQYCGAKLLIDTEEKHTYQHIQYDNMEQSGYEFEKGKLKAQEEAEERAYAREQEQREAYQKELKEHNRKIVALKFLGWVKENIVWIVLGFLVGWFMLHPQ